MVFPTVLTDEELKGIAVPLLFIVGDNEKIYSAEEAVERIKRIAPAIKTKIIPDASHGLIFSQTEIVNNTIIEFLK